MKPKPTTLAVGAVAAAMLAAAGIIYGHRGESPPPPPPPAVRADAAGKMLGDLREVLAAYRKIIVLLVDEAKLGAEERALANQVGQCLFHENLKRIADLGTALGELAAAGDATWLASIEAVLAYVESDPGLFDADRLAFREILRALQDDVARNGTLPAIKFHKRIGEDLDALAEIERNYDKEIRQIFGRFETRAIELKRERWDDYVASIRKRFTREQILKDHGIILPYPAPPDAPAKATREEGREAFGHALPPKTLVLTFDDGPHGTYTGEIAAILEQRGIPAVFFQVGSNLGAIGADGKPRLGRRAALDRQLLDAGHAVANHSLTHAQLSKRDGDALRNEILGTDALLKAADARRSPLFRFPYGARNAEGLAVLDAAGLRSIMWNIDSLDWADPVPNSIVQRVMQTVAREGRGIVLFHDIHERTVKALPAILDRLAAEGYRFAGWDGQGFSVARTPPSQPVPAGAAGGYGDSWAIVIGIDDYLKWPRLQHAVRDARAVRDALIRRFAFAPQRIVTLENRDATRSGILNAFHDLISHGGMKRNDRLFVFFAGHGATRQLSSGRDLGYLVPADADLDPARLGTDAIPMTELQNIAEGLAAKHALFVMDACYSGLGLTRGAAPGNFLRDNAKRLGRQMLTAGGADQLVADGGPNGHSVFTWALLQGLAGKGDLNGDGIVTATELAAYVAPAVAAASRQTPAFGSLPGSEGGDFVFELPAEAEFLNAQSMQLPADAIALNSRLDAPPAGPAASPAGAPSPAPGVMVRDLLGTERMITPPVAVPTSARQRAQRANDRGLQLYREKHYAEAEAQFTEALKLNPEFALAANNLGFVYFKQDRHAEAARWFENAIRIDPSRAVAYLNLGDAYARSGDRDKAQKAYATYLALAPDGPGAAHVRQRMSRR